MPEGPLKKEKAYFAPIPNRALSDPKMSLERLRILGEVAAHDRFSSNGLGYTLSIREMARRLKRHAQHVAVDVKWLMDHCYLEARPHPERSHKQVRMLCVIYTDADREYPANRNATPARPEARNRNATPARYSAIPPARSEKPTVTVDHQNRNGPNPENSGNSTAYEALREQPKGYRINSAKAARFSEKRALHDDSKILSVGAQLAKFERAFRKDPAQLDVETWLVRLERFQDELEAATPEYQRAYRLAEDVRGWIDYCDWQRNELGGGSAAA
jgi:hypothetical protein